MARIKSGRNPQIVKVPFTGKAAIIKDSTLVMPGVTQATDLGLIIPVPTANAAANQFGILKGDSVVANDSVQAGTTWTFAEVELLGDYDLLEIDYSMTTADFLTLTSACSTTSLAITSLQNNDDCCWFYVAAGTGVGQLLFATANNSGTATLMTAPSPALDTTSKVIVIQRIGHTTAVLNANSQIKSTAAVGTYPFFNLENYIDSPSNGISKQLLNPVLHNGITLKGPIVNGVMVPKVTFSSVGIPRLIAGYA